MTKPKRERHTLFDDTFRTIEQECDDALIYFVNRMFKEHHKRTAKVEHLRNEHYDHEKGKPTEKSITDARFSITEGNKTKYYHLECESRGFGEVVMIRMFRYGISHAGIGRDKETPYKLTVKLPRSGVLILRDKGNPPDHISFEIITPGGKITYDAPVIRLSDYSLDRIFKQKMYFLIPFFFVNLEARFGAYDNNADDRKELEKILNDIIDRLETVDESELSLRSKGVIIEETVNIIKGVAYNRKNVQKEVDDIMGGKPHKLKWLEQYDGDMAASHAQGRKDEKLVDIKNLMSSMNWSSEQAMQALKIPESDRPKYSEKL